MATDFRLKEQLPELTDRIVASYHDLSFLQHLGHCPPPSVEEVVSIVLDLKQILFPGYRGRQNLHWGNVTYHVGDLVDSLHDRLTQQFGRALRHASDRTYGKNCEKSRTTDFEREGQEKAIAFLDTIPTLRETLALDVQAAFDGDPAARSFDEIIFCYPGLQAVTVHRIAHEIHRLGVPLVPRMLTEWTHMQTGIDIHPAAQIGPRFFIDHGTGVVIGETCEIHENVKIYQGVTLGALSFDRASDGTLVRGTKRHPTLERDVVVYSNASILGGETTIGRGSVIGAGVTLGKSVPPNTVVTIEKPSLKFREAS